MIMIDGMGGLVGWATVNGVRVGVYDADRASNALQDEQGLTWEEAAEVIAAAEAGLAESVEGGDIGASPVIVHPADAADIARMIAGGDR